MNSSRVFHGASAFTTVVFGLLVARAIGTKSFVVKLLFLLTIGISKIGGGVTRIV
jgi:hypothetical protein